MKIRLFSSLALVIVLAVTALAASRVAVVRSVEGKVSADGKPLKQYTPLTEGAKLSLGAGAEVTVDYLKGKRREVIQGPGEVVVGSTGSKGSAKVAASGGDGSKSSLPSSQNSRQIAGHVVRSYSPGGASPQPDRGVRLSTMGVLEGPAPVFRWVPGEAATAPFHLEVRGDEGVVWMTSTEAQEVAYSGPELKQDEVYFVEVWSDAQYGGLTQSPGAQAPFSLLSADTTALLDVTGVELRAAARESKDPRPLLLLMEIYLDHAMLSEAVQAGEETLTYRDQLSREEVRDLHAMLARLYDTLGEEEKSSMHRSQQS